MNTALLVISGIIVGLAGTLVPRKRRLPRAPRKPQRKAVGLKALQDELAPFVHFGS